MKRPAWGGKPDSKTFWVATALSASILILLAYVVVQGAAHGAFR